MQLLVIQYTIQYNTMYTCVTWQDIDYKVPEDETIVSKHVVL